MDIDYSIVLLQLPICVWGLRRTRENSIGQYGQSSMPGKMISLTFGDFGDLDMH